MANLTSPLTGQSMWTRVLTGAIALAVLALGPYILPMSWISVIGLIFLAIIGAAGLNILQGCAGQLSIGNAGFMAIGAFVGGSAAEYWHWEFVLCVLFGGLAGVVSGIVVGFPALRIRGLYLLVGTLALVFIIQYAGTLYETKVVGVSGVITGRATIFGWNINGFTDWYYVIGVAAVLALLIFRNIDASKMGRALRAIKSNEEMATCLGVDPRRYIIFAFAISSGLIGAQGALFAFYNDGAEIGSFTLALSFQYVAMIIIGGEGSLVGTVVGPALVVSLPFIISGLINMAGSGGSVGAYIASNLGDIQYLIFGLLTAVVMIYGPRGLGPIAEDAVLRELRRFGRGLTRTSGSAEQDSYRVPDQAPQPRVKTRPAPSTGDASAAEQGNTSSAGTLSVSGLSVRYADVVALRDVSFTVGLGDLVGIVGPNGAGKTTTLRAITGFLPGERARLAAGSVHLNGSDLTGANVAARARLGIALVPESGKVFAGMSVEDNLAVAIGKQAARKNRELTYDLFPQLARRATALAGQLSGGERQMLGMARVLVRRPSVLLVDEFSLGLAPAAVEQLYEVIARLRDSAGLAIVVVDEKLEYLTSVATHLVVLSDGAVALSGAVGDLSVSRVEESYFGIRAPGRSLGASRDDASTAASL
jgi:branched-chain amino acid transport system permease protein